MVNRKRLAILTSQAENAYSSQFLDGFAPEAQRLGYDVVVFATFLKNGCSDEFQTGELNIYNLCNFELFDGIVLVPEQLVLGNIYNKLAEKIKNEYHKPVVVADRNHETFKYVVGEDDKGIEAIVSHVIEKHRCTDIAFMTGYADNLHAQLRLKGYRNAMEKHNLTVDESRIFYGDFWYDKGEEVVAGLEASGKMPQAICCGSDAMAISVRDALKTRGIRVPEDIILTGFDADGDGIREYKSITSVIRHNKALGFETIKLIHSCISGEPYVSAADNYGLTDFVLSSCGCKNRISLGKSEEYVNKFHTVYDYSGFDSGYNFMLDDMISRENLNDCLWVLSWHTRLTGKSTRIFICLCEDWVDIDRYMENGPRIEGYPEEMVLALVRDDDHESVDLNRRIKTANILDEIAQGSEKPGVYYCTPVHFNEICIGYTVRFMDEDMSCCDVIFSKWSRYTNVGLEAIHRRLITERMYEIMRKQALMDDLTGVYNRNGLYNMAPGIINEAIEKKNQLLVIVGDLNCMKYINDNFGHNEGDENLRFCAKALSEATKGLNGYVFRTGGDEFIFMGNGNFTQDELAVIITDVNNRLMRYLEEANKTYPSRIALGYSCAKIKTFDTLERLLAPADRMMYRNKKKLKKELDLTKIKR